MPNAQSVHRQMAISGRKERRKSLKRMQAFESFLTNKLYGTLARCAVLIQKRIRGYLTRKHTRELKKTIALKRGWESIKRNHPNANKDELQVMRITLMCKLGLVKSDMLNSLLTHQTLERQEKKWLAVMANRKRREYDEREEEEPAAKVPKKA
jgi:hypothetical protein